jgi:hypothetical protein
LNCQELVTSSGQAWLFANFNLIAFLLYFIINYISINISINFKIEIGVMSMVKGLIISAVLGNAIKVRDKNEL